MVNRVNRWMKRNPTESLERKMNEWRTESVQEYFEKIFQDTLNDEEIKLVKYLQLEFDYRFFYQG